MGFSGIGIIAIGSSLPRRRGEPEGGSGPGGAPGPDPRREAAAGVAERLPGRRTGPEEDIRRGADAVSGTAYDGVSARWSSRGRMGEGAEASRPNDPGRLCPPESAEAAVRDVLDRAGRSVADLTGSHVRVCGGPHADAPDAALFGRRVLDRVGAGRVRPHVPVDTEPGVLAALCSLVHGMRQDTVFRTGLLLVPADPLSGPAAELSSGGSGSPGSPGSPILDGVALAVLAERGHGRNRLRSVVTRKAAAPSGPSSAGSAGAVPATRSPRAAWRKGTTALRGLPVWPGPHPGHHRAFPDGTPPEVCDMVGRALREARTPWETIDHVTLNTVDGTGIRFRRHFRLRRDQVTEVALDSGNPHDAGLLLGLKDILDSGPEPGSRILLVSLGPVVHSAAVLEV